MAVMMSEVYDAFIAAGTPEDKALKAAEAVANDETRFAKIDAGVLVSKWMAGAILAGVLSLALRGFFG